MTPTTRKGLTFIAGLVLAFFDGQAAAADFVTKTSGYNHALFGLTILVGLVVSVALCVRSVV